jgi:hypothetical protein
MTEAERSRELAAIEETQRVCVDELLRLNALVDSVRRDMRILDRRRERAAAGG